ncbi:MAG: hypothetical protein GXO86_00885 [Chlorobi bacterium]|nr:hypothetical protein [Chlorobiota bacterium]
MGKNRKERKERKKEETDNKRTNRVLLNRLFYLGLVIMAFVLYYNSLSNDYSFGDKPVQLIKTQHGFHPVIKDIPEIFNTPYSEQKGNFRAYRPLSRTLFAIEYQFTGNSKKIPQNSHVFNLLLYLLGVLLLFGLLKRLFGKYNPWFPFLIALFFLANPLHTAVVDNLRNRDILLAFIFGITAVRLFVRWIDKNENKSFYIGSFIYFLALWSHEQAINFLPVFPLVLYFFTDAKRKQVWTLFFSQTAVALFALFLPYLWLPAQQASLEFVENPLVENGGFFTVLGTAVVAMGWALKMLVFPYPLRFYYGYNMIETGTLDNSWMWVSLVVIIVLLWIAVKGFRKKDLLSFIILFFFLSFIGYSNLFMLMPGIVDERFLFVPSLAVSMLVTWLLFTIFRVENGGLKRMIGVWILSFFILLPYCGLTITRNKDWKTEKTIFDHDLPLLEKSAYVNNMYAAKRLEPIANAMKNDASPYKFILPVIQDVEKHTWKALDVDTTYIDAWVRLGYINAEFHGNQSLRRVKSFTDSGKKEELDKEKLKVTEYFTKADFYYNKALEYGPQDSAYIYYLKSEAGALQRLYDKQALDLMEAIKLEPTNRKYQARLIEAFMYGGRFPNALAAIERYRREFPDSDIPYINLGGYYYFKGDTTRAIVNYKIAIQKGTKPEVGKLLAKYYTEHGNIDSANYFLQKAYEASKTYDPEKY